MIHILCAEISQIDETEYDRLFLKASPERQLRAQRYLRQQDKIRCVVADALVRRAVAETLGISDFSVTLDDGGKPYIQDRKDFHFNLSHSGRWVTMAYGDTPVGIDIQQMRLSPEKIPKFCRLFAPDEAVYILDGTEDSLIDRFFRIWTGKESYLKFLGTGLRKALNSFSVLNEATHPGVTFNTVLRNGYCLTLCAQEPASDIMWINALEIV